MHTRHVLSLPVLFLLLAVTGCGSTNPHFTQAIRTSLGADELSGLTFFVSMPIELRSTKKGPVEGEGLFKVEKRKAYVVGRETAGKAVRTGEGWIAIDFGDGVILTFRQSDNAGRYVIPGWGTVTINGERFDVNVGVLTGAFVELLYAPGLRDPAATQPG